jgi:hypothetical protein
MGVELPVPKMPVPKMSVPPLPERNDPNFMSNKAIEVEASDRFSMRRVPPPLLPLRNHRCAGNFRREEDIEEMR